MTTHHVEVVVDQAYLDRLSTLRAVTDQDRAEAYAQRLVCSDRAACEGWVECRETHEVDGVSAEDGPYDYECDQCDTGAWAGKACPRHPYADSDDEFTFHDVPHTWHSGHGWTVPTEGCPAEDNFALNGDRVDGIPMDRPGTYPVEIDWDDTEMYVTLIEETPR